MWSLGSWNVWFRFENLVGLGVGFRVWGRLLYRGWRTANTTQGLKHALISTVLHIRSGVRFPP